MEIEKVSERDTHEKRVTKRAVWTVLMVLFDMAAVGIIIWLGLAYAGVI